MRIKVIEQVETDLVAEGGLNHARQSDDEGMNAITAKIVVKCNLQRIDAPPEAEYLEPPAMIDFEDVCHGILETLCRALAPFPGITPIQFLRQDTKADEDPALGSFGKMIRIGLDQLLGRKPRLARRPGAVPLIEQPAVAVTSPNATIVINEQRRLGSWLSAVKRKGIESRLGRGGCMIPEPFPVLDAMPSIMIDRSAAT